MPWEAYTRSSQTTNAPPRVSPTICLTSLDVRPMGVVAENLEHGGLKSPVHGGGGSRTCQCFPTV